MNNIERFQSFGSLLQRLTCNVFHETFQLVVAFQSLHDFELRTREIRVFISLMKKKLLQFYTLTIWLTQKSTMALVSSISTYSSNIHSLNTFCLQLLDEMYILHSGIFSLRSNKYLIPSSLLTVCDMSCSHIRKSIAEDESSELKEKLNLNTANVHSLLNGKILLSTLNLPNDFSFKDHCGVLSILWDGIFEFNVVPKKAASQKWKILSVGARREILFQSASEIVHKKGRTLPANNFVVILQEFREIIMLQMLCNLISETLDFVNSKYFVSVEISRENHAIIVWINENDREYHSCFTLDNICSRHQPLVHLSSSKFGSTANQFNILSIERFWVKSLASHLQCEEFLEYLISMMVVMKLKYLFRRLQIESCKSLRVVNSSNCIKVVDKKYNTLLVIFVVKESGKFLVQAEFTKDSAGKSVTKVNQFQDEINDIDSDKMFFTFLQSKKSCILKSIATWRSLCELLNESAFGQPFDRYFDSENKTLVNGSEIYNLCWWMFKEAFCEIDGSKILASSVGIKIRNSGCVDATVETFFDKNDGCLYFSSILLPTGSIRCKDASRVMLSHISKTIYSQTIQRSLVGIEQNRRLSIICWGTFTRDKNIIFHYEGELTHITWDSSFIYFVSYCYGDTVTIKGETKCLQSNLCIDRYSKAHGLDDVTMISIAVYKYSTVPSTSAVRIEFDRFEMFCNSNVLNEHNIITVKTIFSIISDKLLLEYYNYVNKLATVASLHRCIFCFLYLVFSQKSKVGSDNFYSLQLISAYNVKAGVQLLIGLHRVDGGCAEICNYFLAIIICDMEQDDYGISFRNIFGCEFFRMAANEMNFQQGKSVLKTIISCFLNYDSAASDFT